MRPRRETPGFVTEYLSENPLAHCKYALHTGFRIDFTLLTIVAWQSKFRELAHPAFLDLFGSRELNFLKAGQSGQIVNVYDIA